jgi:DNA-binding MarR family transcriptional regulator
VKTTDLLARIERDWRAARPDVDPTPMLTVIAIQRTSVLLQTELDAFFAARDLTPAGFDVLATLRRSSPESGLPLAQLGQLMAVTPPAVTKRVDALEARGLVVREAHESDRRAFRLKLTPAGRQFVDDVLEAHVANEKRLLGDLTTEERRVLCDLLARVAGS